MRKGKMRSAAICLAAAFILASYMAQTTSCYRLKKTGRHGADAAGSTGVREGTVVFGTFPEKSSSNAPGGSETGYQADSPVWSRSRYSDGSESMWRRMSHSLQCGGDQMKYRVMGPGASQFVVEQENAPPMPLSHVPSSCGYSMQRNSIALIMIVPYDGCSMVEEGENYRLPMRWRGSPVSLICPKPTPPEDPNPPIPQSYTLRGPVYIPDVHQQPMSIKDAQMPNYEQSPLQVTAVPSSQGKLTNTEKPGAKGPHQVYLPHYYNYYNPWKFPQLPMPTTAQTTTEPTTKPAMGPFPNPQWPPFLPYGHSFHPLSPYGAMPYYNYFPHHPTSKPVMTTTTAVPTTTATTTMPESALGPFPHYHPHAHPHGHFPFPIMPYPYMYPHPRVG